MNMILKPTISFIFSLVILNTTAQKIGRDFKEIDEAVKKMGALDSMNMGTISNLLTKKLDNKTDKARAIFTWIATNISYDIKNARKGVTDKNSSTDALLYRKATGTGYANLFQDMCSAAGIRCLTVNGFVKYGVDQIGDLKTEINHTWNVIQLGQSPEAWYYVDACRGSGYTDQEFKNFTKAFNPDYFFADLTIFNWEHYPDNTAWYLGPKPKNKKDFFDLPVLKPIAYELGLKRFSPDNGIIKVKVNKPVYFSYQIRPDADISKVTLAYGEGKKKKTKEMDFVITGKNLSFSYKFEEEDSFPVTILINGKELMEYDFEIE